MNSIAPPPSSLADFAESLARAPGPDVEVAEAAQARNAALTKPAGALGRLEELALWYCAWKGQARPKDPAAQIIVFAGEHGVAANGVSAYPPSVTAQMVANFERGGAAINQLAALQGATLTIAPIDLGEPTIDLSQGAAMREPELLSALQLGWRAIDPEADVVVLGEMGIGNTTAAAALAAGLFGGAAEDWVGRGTGVSSAALQVKRRCVDQALALHRRPIQSAGAFAPLEALRRLGGRELAAIAGAALCARMRRKPLLLDGYVVSAAAAVWEAIRPGALDHAMAAHRSAEPGHARLLHRLGSEPLLDLGMRLGEGSGAAVALGLLRAAIACHSGMARFDEASVDGPA